MRAGQVIKLQNDMNFTKIHIIDIIYTECLKNLISFEMLQVFCKI